MYAIAVPHVRTAPDASAVATILVSEQDRERRLVSFPRAEIQIVARFGEAARGGLDVHAFGGRARAHRKVIPSGLRAVTARLRLGAHEAVLGVPASALAGRIVALEDLWGDAAARRLLDRLAEARDTVGAAAELERAISERTHLTHLTRGHRGPSPLVLEAAERLASANVTEVAFALGVSERHLRRIFRETVGMGPKTFAKLARFHRALGVARSGGLGSWASIAADAGYYDQAHLIAEFRAIAGATPPALLEELRASPNPMSI